MKNLPWGPHGAEAPPHSVTPNPTATSPMPSFDQAGEGVMASGGGGGLGAILANIVLSLVMMALLWIPAACLYPLTAATGIGAALLTRSMVAGALPPDAGDVATVLGLVVGAVLVAIGVRMEIRLARSASYRMVRHGVRLVLLSIWAIPILQLALGATAPGSTTRFVFATVTSPRVLAQFLTSPTHLGLWVAAILGLHLLLWRGERASRFWHRRLVWIGLK